MFPPAVNVIFIKLDDDADWRYSVHLSENLRITAKNASSALTHSDQTRANTQLV